VQRHRRYVGQFKFEHPELFEEYLAAEHPAFNQLQHGFWLAEDDKRIARLPPLFGDCGPRKPPPVDQTDTRIQVEDLENDISLPLPEGFELEELDIVPRPPRPELVEAVALLRQTTRRSDAVFTVLRTIGLDALRPPWEITTALSYPAGAEDRRVGAELRELMWGEIEQWYRDARSAIRHESRMAAAQKLQRVGVVLAGEQRGRGRSTVGNPMMVSAVYHMLLYRLLRAIALFHDWPWAETGKARIEAVAWTCGLREARLREYLQRDSRQTGWQPVRAVREWTCSLFEIKPKTLSNALTVAAKPLLPPSRK
jgi:hypothetical protein